MSKYTVEMDVQVLREVIETVDLVSASGHIHSISRAREVLAKYDAEQNPLRLPWSYREGDVHDCKDWVLTNSGCIDPDCSHLIAAAPDLFGVVERFVKTVGQYGYGGGSQLYKDANTALKKAKGES